jgi:hypothetical protein
MDSKKIALASLAVTAVGTAIAAFQLYPSWRAAELAATAEPAILPMTNPAEPGISATDCSAAGVSGGTVSVDCSRDVNISTAASDRTFEMVELNVSRDSIDGFVARMGEVHDKVVRMEIRIEPEAGPTYRLFSKSDGSSQNELNITYKEPCEYGEGQCGGIEYVVNTSDGGALYWTNGSYVLSGYFIVQPVQGMHQGYVSVALIGISDGQARLADPASR